MENIEILKSNLISQINACTNKNLLEKIDSLLSPNNMLSVAEPQSIYDTEKPMTEQEVEDYFKEDIVELTPYQMKMVMQGLEDVKQGRVYENDEIEKYFEEWLKD